MKRSLLVPLLLLVGFSACRCERRGAEAPEPAEPRDAVSKGQPVEPAQIALPPVEILLTSINPIVERVKGSVVNVEVLSVGRRGGGRTLDELFSAPGPRPPRSGIGSGVIIDEEGHVLTNHHVIEGASAIRVKLEDGRTFPAHVVGSDPLTDVALIQLDEGPEALPVAELGDSDSLRVGDWVVAIGNPFGLSSSVSLGILSAKARNIRVGPYDDFLQTDAAINPGNSGGPLFNLDGKVVGINTAIIGQGSGIGFAIPSALAAALIPRLQEDGKVRRGYLGVAVQDLSPPLGEALGVDSEDGAVISSVDPGTPAALAGLRADDVVVALNEEPIESAQALTRTVGMMLPGERALLTVLRGDTEVKVPVVLGLRPDLR